MPYFDRAREKGWSPNWEQRETAYTSVFGPMSLNKYKSGDTPSAKDLKKPFFAFNDNFWGPVIGPRMSAKLSPWRFSIFKGSEFSKFQDDDDAVKDFVREAINLGHNNLGAAIQAWMSKFVCIPPPSEDRPCPEPYPQAIGAPQNEGGEGLDTEYVNKGGAKNWYISDVATAPWAVKNGVRFFACVRAKFKCKPPPTPPREYREWADPKLDTPRDPSLPDPSMPLPAPVAPK